MNGGPPLKHAICSSKMFGEKLEDLAPIREALASYVSPAAEKLRSLCIPVMVATNSSDCAPSEPQVLPS